MPPCEISWFTASQTGAPSVSVSSEVMTRRFGSHGMLALEHEREDAPLGHAVERVLVALGVQAARVPVVGELFDLFLEGARGAGAHHRAALLRLQRELADEAEHRVRDRLARRLGRGFDEDEHGFGGEALGGVEDEALPLLDVATHFHEALEGVRLERLEQLRHLARRLGRFFALTALERLGDRHEGADDRLIVAGVALAQIQRFARMRGLEEFAASLRLRRGGGWRARGRSR